jgi:DNA topoisomerase IB
MPRLRRADCSAPGWTRRKNGRGFVYLDADGARLTDAEELERIRGLTIPPAWKDVWICPYPNGHLQAVGTDAAGRRQYLYHEDWRKRRDAEKFEHMLDFARALPSMRAVCAEHLALDDLSRERVLACAVRLLDRGFFRIGTEGYAEQHQTYGLATIQKKHCKLMPDNSILFDFAAKGGLRRIQAIVDPEVLEVVGTLKKRRGGSPELLAYKAGGRWCDVRSGDINAYVKEISGGEFTAKDFRTWNATVLAAMTLAVSASAAGTKTARQRAMTYAVKTVAHYLGNTPAVARSSYIDPRVFDRYRSGWTISGAIELLGEDVDLGAPSTQGAIEEAVLELLADNRDSDAMEKVEDFGDIALSA